MKVCNTENKKAKHARFILNGYDLHINCIDTIIIISRET
jgi:hypothetical protein